MRQFICAGLTAILLGSCGVVKKKTTYADGPPTVSVVATDSVAASVEGENTPAGEGAYTDTPGPEETVRAEAVVRTALTYTGTRYRYGGTTRKGMDCSGLLYVAFQEHDFPIPRVSREMADAGRRVRVQQLRKGDLLFFKTTRRGGKINHVGMVVEVAGDDVKFIHSTTSRGVIVSSLREGFWNYAFVKATRVF
ncbi:C40 family peptidase [Robiginitalea sp. SC105]|uniref:C40 family peptidase n=1 Tax=Robiginitalea sp. SC105 TaxID=2762332 RepID=UPI00163A6C54|nr:C40 family peptidase [Robiginitalea sp. SC105]MBC2837796.1 C40 family peptidase [Robiginitalea sp. SC105]